MITLDARLRSNETTLAVVAVVGYTALVVTSGGSLLSGSAIETFFAYLAVPVLIGLA